MDTLDVRILRAYFQEPTLAPLPSTFRVSLAAVAKRVGADEDTVRHRIRKILESGFIADWRLYLNPRLWGGGAVSAWFDLDPERPKRELVDELRLVPGMTHVTTTYDSLTAFLEFEDERALPRQVELLRRLVGVDKVFVARDAFPECRATLTGRDWDLIRALRRDPRRSYAELAEALRLSTRTVKARLSRILAQNVAFAWPALNVRALLGGVFVLVVARYPGHRKAEIDAAITRRLEPYLWHVVHMLPYRPGDPWPCGYDAFVPNLSEARQILEWVKAVPGVQEARVYLYEDVISFFDAYDETLDRRLSEMPTGRFAASRSLRPRPGLTRAAEPP